MLSAELLGAAASPAAGGETLPAVTVILGTTTVQHVRLLRPRTHGGYEDAIGQVKAEVKLLKDWENGSGT